MGISTRPYKIIIKNNKNILETISCPSLLSALWCLMNKLDVMNALSCIDEGYFVESRTPVTGESLFKVYRIVINAPFTIIDVKKMTTGPFDIEAFENTLEIIKEKYFERI